MRKGRSIGKTTGKRPGKKKEQISEAKKLPETKKKSLQTIRTTGYLEKALSEINIQEEDIEELFENDFGIDTKDLEDTAVAEDSEDDDLREEYDDEEDDYIDYDETEPFDPFDIEDRAATKRASYIAEVLINDNSHEIKFLQVPKVEIDDILISDTLFNRYKLYFKMASFLAEKQLEYFLTHDDKKLNNLNQQDLVKYLNDNKSKLTKEHISRMLDVLFFRIKGIGDIPSKYLFRRYGHKIRLSKDEKLNMATEFLTTCDIGLTQIEKARRFRKFIKDKAGLEVPLSKGKNEHNQYKNLKNIIRMAEKQKRR